jgi:hypothetical protein
MLGPVSVRSLAGLGCLLLLASPSCGGRTTLDSSSAGGAGGSSAGASSRPQAGIGAAPTEPDVSWHEAAYRECPTYYEGQIIACWGLATSEGCQGSCRACLCTSRCAAGAGPAQCAGVSDVGAPECLGAGPRLPAACLLGCDAEPCPAGMQCVPYPGLARRVCMYLSASSP